MTPRDRARTSSHLLGEDFVPEVAEPYYNFRVVSAIVEPLPKPRKIKLREQRAELSEVIAALFSV